MSTSHLGGTLKLAEDLTLSRIGYGAMQLAGPGVWGPPRDRGEAIAVLREAVERGITHIDTSDYYGPYIVNELIREALHPYPKALHIVTKVGARRAPDKSWPVALSREELTSAVHDNMKHLRLDTLDVVNLRVGGFDRPTPGSIAEPLSVLAALRQQGLIRHLGVSNVSAEQLTDSISTLLTRNLLDVFGENDPARRRAAIDEVFTEDCVFYDPSKGVYRGRDEIDHVAGAIRATHPDFRYQPILEL